MKHRPCSAKPMVTTIPIYIDDFTGDNITENQRPSQQSSSNKLNQFIPELPAFPLKSNSAANLYSKFVVKGLKNEKISVVKNALEKSSNRNKNKQSIWTVTETQTAANTHHHFKNRPEDISTISISQIRRSEKSDRRRSKNSNKMHSKETFHLQERDDNYINDLMTTEEGKNKKQKSQNIFVRSNSAKGFEPTKLFRQSENQDLSHRRQMHKSATQKILNRPQTAKNNYPKGRYDQIQEEEKEQTNRQIKSLMRPMSGTINNKATISMSETDPINTLINAKTNLSVVRAEDLVTIKEGISKNFLEKNRKNASNYSKKQSIYLTNLEDNNNSGILHKVTRHSFKKLRESSPSKIKKTEFNKREFLQEAQFQQISQNREKTIEELANYQQKIKIFDELYENQSSVPNSLNLKTIKVSNAANKQTVLYSMPLDIQRYKPQNHQKRQQSIANEKELTECFEDYVQECNMLQLSMNQEKGANIQSVNKDKQAGCLNIWEVSAILELGYDITNLKKSNSATFEQLTQKKHQLYEKIKVLKFLANKNEEDRLKFVQDLQYDIVAIKEGQYLIRPNQQLSSIFLIINGSIQTTKISSTEEEITDFIQIPQKQTFTYFDGELFGEPSRICSSEVLPRAQIEAIALEPSVVMKICYRDYLKKFLSGSDLQEKLTILQLAFNSQVENGLLKHHDFQTLAFYLQKSSFKAKELIFRQDEVYDSLIFIKSGQVKLINESILVRKKEKIKNMKERDKKFTKSKQKSQSLKMLYLPKNQIKSTFAKNQKRDEQNVCLVEGCEKTLRISQHRKHNLIDYELIKQTNTQIYFYKITEHQSYKLGDGINWESFDGSELSIASNNEGSNTSQKLFRPKYSLMSDSDITEIFTFSKVCFGYLPLEVKKILIKKVKMIMNKKQNQKSLADQNNSSLNIIRRVHDRSEIERDPIRWDLFKQGVCREVLQNKKNQKLRKNNWMS